MRVSSHACMNATAAFEIFHSDRVSLESTKLQHQAPW